MTQDWRIQTDSSDFFGQQKKKTEIEQRRPTIRQASDLVGPGIGASATRITDYNDLLATFNGYYSSAIGAANAPTATEAFVGQVVSDTDLGGRQTFTGLTSGVEYSRTFTRSPTDPESLGWGPWTGQRVPSSVHAVNIHNTVVASGIEAILTPPDLDLIAGENVYQRISAGIMIRKQGIYTGHIQVGCNSASGIAQILTLRMPFGSIAGYSIGHVNVPCGPTAYFPFTVIANDGSQGFNVSVLQGAGFNVNFWWRFACTRVGDAV